MVSSRYAKIGTTRVRKHPKRKVAVSQDLHFFVVEIDTWARVMNWAFDRLLQPLLRRYQLELRPDSTSRQPITKRETSDSWQGAWF